MTIIRNRLLIISFAILTLACGGSDDPKIDEEQVVIDGLNKTWSVNSVMFESENKTSEWDGFTLNFDQSNGYVGSRLSDESILVWPTSGSYSFPNPINPKLILRSDGVEINIESLTETNVQLAFQITGRNEGGRNEALIGEWVFEMVAN